MNAYCVPTVFSTLFFVVDPLGLILSAMSVQFIRNGLLEPGIIT